MRKMSEYTYIQDHSASFTKEQRWMAEFVYDVILDEKENGYTDIRMLNFTETDNSIELTWVTVHSVPDEPCWRCEKLCREKSCCKDDIGTPWEKAFPAVECENFVERKS